ncbi:sodium:solute symporter [Flavobacteriales bacterium]|jgi:SSS family solute:Na+ symporter|nr:sodium:solute symporter [Flavobacteriales bacterium]MDA9003658.1 sodium:solute symporter [Flavobacteriales bacterium]
MTPTLIIAVLSAYFAFLVLISKLTSKDQGNETFFMGKRQSPWYIVAFGMIGASLSGVTFISVPGWVASSQFSYVQMVLGYLVGYAVIATVLMPIYYKLNLTSIYTYLEDRFGFWSYKSGAFYFILSRTIGAAFRLYLVANVLQVLVFDFWNVPFAVTVALTILLIWLYTHKAGIKTIIWTDTLQTLFMLIAVVLCFYYVADAMNFSLSKAVSEISASKYAKMFFFEDLRSPSFFPKKFLAGAFLAIVMTGLDQDMMQKNLSCPTLKDAQKNMFWFSVILVFVNVLFLALGALLYLFASSKGIVASGDELFASVAMHESMPLVVGLFFILGLVAAAYSSADSALTALTTSFCVDFLNVQKMEATKQVKLRKRTHVLFSILLFLVILLFKLINDESVVSALFKVAGYTYGPLLGMYAFGLFTSYKIKDHFVIPVVILAPILTYVLQLIAPIFWGFSFGFELLIINGLISFTGLFFIRTKSS